MLLRSFLLTSDLNPNLFGRGANDAGAEGPERGMERHVPRDISGGCAIPSVGSGDYAHGKCLKFEITWCSSGVVFFWGGAKKCSHHSIFSFPLGWCLYICCSLSSTLLAYKHILVHISFSYQNFQKFIKVVTNLSLLLLVSNN